MQWKKQCAISHFIYKILGVMMMCWLTYCRYSNEGMNSKTTYYEH